LYYYASICIIINIGCQVVAGGFICPKVAEGEFVLFRLTTCIFPGYFFDCEGISSIKGE